MYTVETAKKALLSGKFDSMLGALYAKDAQSVDAQHTRYADAIDEFCKLFPVADAIDLYSAPGRTEVGGNHTDHQRGAVLAAAVNLDVIAVASPNQSGIIRIQSKGFRMDVIDLSDLSIQQSEIGRSAGIIRGIAARFKELGLEIGGFDAYTTSSVLKGSGLSSSAAFENLVGTILNHAYNSGKIDAVEIAKISQYSEVHYFGKACGLMDQMASSVGGFASMDFKNPEAPVIRKIDFDFADSGYALCIVDTKGSHADLTPDYVAVPTEMKSVAAYLGKDVLREVDPADFYKHISEIREKTGDRAVLRAMHFFNDNQTALDEAAALEAGDFETFKTLIQSSGNSSFKYLQNVYSPTHAQQQGVSIGLALSESVLHGRGVCRVHGGGFAGTIQAFVPMDLVAGYRDTLEGVFGKGSCYVLNIRPLGGVKVSE